MLIVYKDGDNVSVVTPILESGLTIDQIAKKDVPAGVAYKFIGDNEAAAYLTGQVDIIDPDGEGVGALPYLIEQVEAQIADIQSAQHPKKIAYPHQPENEDSLYQSELDALLSNEPAYLPTNDPFQSQRDIENAMENVRRKQEWQSKINDLKSSFVPYSDRVAKWQAECAKIDSDYQTSLDSFNQIKLAEIAKRQTEINRYQTELDEEVYEEKQAIAKKLKQDQEQSRSTDHN